MAGQIQFDRFPAAPQPQVDLDRLEHNLTFVMTNHFMRMCNVWNTGVVHVADHGIHSSPGHGRQIDLEAIGQLNGDGLKSLLDRHIIGEQTQQFSDGNQRVSSGAGL